MNVEKLLSKCRNAELENDYEKLIALADEVLEKSPDNQIAIGYKSFAYIQSGKYDKASELLDRGLGLYPKNYYLKNNLAMLHYELGEYEKSLECCEEGLKIKDFHDLRINKILALIKLERIEDAIEFFQSLDCYIDLEDLLIEGGKYVEALEYNLSEYGDEWDVKIIDKIKDSIHENGLEIPDELDGFYANWIHAIKSKSNTETCPECGGKLLPIVWGYPSSEVMEKAMRDEVYLGGCVLPLIHVNYHCINCDGEFNLGYEGFHIECENDRIADYVKYKIRELTSKLKTDYLVFIKSHDSLKGELKGFDDEEFDEFISHLTDLGFLTSPREGYIKLAGFDELECAKEYLDEGKFAAPGWLVYPQLSAWTIGWRMGAGENYAMNKPAPTDEFKRLFPMPRYWQFRVSESPYKPHPLLSYFWNEDGKPQYPNFSEGIAVNDFIALEDEGKFSSDTFLFSSIEHAVLLSKFLSFEKCGRNEDLESLRSLELTPEEEKLWKVHEYSIILNAGYFKIMQDAELKGKLLETGNEPLIYVSDDAENLFGRALMEIRDEIRRICANEERIDWQYTEYLKHKPWL